MRILRFIFPFLFGASEIIKILYLTTCNCQGQPFNAWFFPAFQHPPWTFQWTYHGLTWLAGPYSALWWALNSPAVLGYGVFFSYLLFVDAFLTFLFYRKTSITWASIWTLFSIWWVAIDPVDFWIVAFSFLGRWKWPFLPLAIITKLPLGSELYTGNFAVWDWVLSNPNSLHGPENFSRYGILGAFWLTSLLSRDSFREKLFKTIHPETGNKKHWKSEEDSGKEDGEIGYSNIEGSEYSNGEKDENYHQNGKPEDGVKVHRVKHP